MDGIGKRLAWSVAHPNGETKTELVPLSHTPTHILPSFGALHGEREAWEIVDEGKIVGLLLF